MYTDHTPTVVEMELDSVAGPPEESEESLVSDARGGLSPAQMVERKLVSMLRSAPLPVSRMQAAGTLRRLS